MADGPRQVAAQDHRGRVTRNIGAAAASLALLIVLAGIGLSLATAPPERLVEPRVLAPGRVVDSAKCSSTEAQQRSAERACVLLQTRHSRLAVSHVYVLEDLNNFFVTSVSDVVGPLVVSLEVDVELLQEADSESSMFELSVSSSALRSSHTGRGIVRSESFGLAPGRRELIDAGLVVNGGELYTGLRRLLNDQNAGQRYEAQTEPGDVLLISSGRLAELGREEISVVEVQYDEWVRRYRVEQAGVTRSLGLSLIWGAAGSILLGLAFVLGIVNWLMRRVALSAETNEAAALASAAEAEEHQKEAVSQRDDAVVAKGWAEESEASARESGLQAEERRLALEVILEATHHQLNREIIQIGYVADDLEQAGADVTELRTCETELQQGRDRITALAQTGADHDDDPAPSGALRADPVPEAQFS